MAEQKTAGTMFMRQPLSNIGQSRKMAKRPDFRSQDYLKLASLIRRSFHPLGPAGEVVLVAQLAFVGAQGNVRARRDLFGGCARGKAFLAIADAGAGLHRMPPSSDYLTSSTCSKSSSTGVARPKIETLTLTLALSKSSSSTTPLKLANGPSSTLT